MQLLKLKFKIPLAYNFPRSPFKLKLNPFPVPFFIIKKIIKFPLTLSMNKTEFEGMNLMDQLSYPSLNSNSLENLLFKPLKSFLQPTKRLSVPFVFHELFSHTAVSRRHGPWATTPETGLRDVKCQLYYISVATGFKILNADYPEDKKNVNYYHEFWLMYLQNELIIAKMKDYVNEIKTIQGKIFQSEVMGGVRKGFLKEV